MSPSWLLLNPNSSSSRLPPLLISTGFTSNSYTVTLTDLTYIWSETLDRRSIIKRSLDEETSIDPSEDARQLRVFLDKIQFALSNGENTGLQLQAKQSPKSDGPASLDLLVTANLPQGLPPLKWPIYLSPLPQSAISSQLLIPVLQAQNARMRDMGRLVETIREKDHVIQKLLDKLDAMGTELGNVFPRVAGKWGKKISRKIADERVKGLGLFDFDEWKIEMAKKERESSFGGVGTILQEAFGGYGRLTENSAGVQNVLEVPESWSQWWENAKQHPIDLSSSTSAETSGHENTAKPKATIKTDNSTTNEEDGDFQIQATPPYLAGSPAAVTNSTSSPLTLQSQAPIEDSTDEEDLDVPSQRSAVPDSFPLHLAVQQPMKLGTIGHPKLAPTPVAPQKPPGETQPRTSAPPSRTQVQHTKDDDDATASEDEDVPAAPAIRKASTTSPHTILKSPQRPKTKLKVLGKIGGKAKKESSPPAPSPPARDRTASPPPAKKAKVKLGVIGHKLGNSSAVARTAVADGAEDRMRIDRRETPPKNHPQGDEERGEADRGRGNRGRREGKEEERPRETSKERADRKREELKRVLEEKSKAPMRKKRKF